MKVIIAGAGIGGLTAALSLQKAGIDVWVYEAVEDILPMGVGLNILPHASRELIELGLKDDIDQIAIRTKAMNYYNHEGKLVISQPCGLHAGYNWPQWSVHRGELHMLLLNTFQQRAGADKVITGARITGFTEQGGTSVIAHFETHPTKALDAECDVLVGADGLHSVTRRQLFPTEGAPIYCGLVLYRGATVAPQYLDGKTMVIIGDKRLRLVSYPISSKTQRESSEKESLINWIGVLPIAKDEAPTEDWNNLSQQEKLKPRYADWKFDWIDVPQIMNSTQEIYEFPVNDRDPLETWTKGRVTLLGDAAHPLIPVSSSGAVQAIIDGRALAYALASHEDTLEGLQAYEAERLETANATVRISRENGPDEVLEIVRQKCPEDAENIHDYVSQEELQAVIDDFKERTGFGIQALNSRPSYNITDI